MDDLIKSDLRETFGITFDEAIPVYGGYLNEKWKIQANAEEELLIKKFSPVRYDNKRLLTLESNLQRQIILHKSGVPSPLIKTHDGKIVRIVNDETAYMIMEYKRGEIKNHENISLTQMYNLGKVCGQMHRVFEQIPLDGLVFDTGNTIDLLWKNYFERLEEAETSGIEEYIKAVKLQKPILDNLSDEFFANLPKGIAHLDFAADNIIFDGEEISAVIDFDSNRYSYIWRDIGRALLSFALHDNQIDKERIEAFVNGYSTHFPFDFSDAVYALRLSWCIEVSWWIRLYCFKETRTKVTRFRNELYRLTQHWFTLDLL